MALDTEIIFFYFERTTQIVIYANFANVLVALFSYALVCCNYTVKYLYDWYRFGVTVRISGLCINRYRPIVTRRCLIGASLHDRAQNDNRHISFLCKEWVHWRSIPSRPLWQSTMTGRRWGWCSIYRHPAHNALHRRRFRRCNPVQSVGRGTHAGTRKLGD